MTWPFPGDLPLARARRAAMAYRAQLRECDRDACDRIDRQLVQWGQGWMVETPATYGLDDWLEPGQAASIALTSTANLRRLRKAGKLTGVLGADGKWRYQARELLRVISATRTRH